MTVIKLAADLNHYGNDQMNRVYSPDGISPTLTVVSGGGRELKILCVNEYDQTGKQRPQQDRIYDSNGLMTTLSAQLGGRFNIGLPIREATKQGYDLAYPGDSINYSVPTSQTRRGRVGNGIANTLDTGCQQGVLTDEYRIRKLTPRECWRLQGFPDWAFDKAAEVNSNSQLYKQAGNSVTVNVIYEIANRLS
jgi:DNA (cytosine-5)-methyltransferase 1